MQFNPSKFSKTLDRSIKLPKLNVSDIILSNTSEFKIFKRKGPQRVWKDFTPFGFILDQKVYLELEDQILENYKEMNI